MAEFVFGDFSEQETEKLFGHEKQSRKVNEPEFPWANEESLPTTIEFGFDVPSVLSPHGVSYPNSKPYNGSSSQQESTSSALTSPPYSSKSSSVENFQTSNPHRHHNRHLSERKSKKKRPPNYYKQEYQQMLEQSKQINGQNEEKTNSNEQTSTDSKYISCDKWVDSTIHHQQLSDHEDQQSTSSSKQSIADDDLETTTDTDNELFHSSSTTKQQTYPVNIQSINQSKSQINTNSSQISNQISNDLNIYSTSVASGASIETLKPSPSSPNKLNSTNQGKPSTWADLFRTNQSNLNQISTNIQTNSPTKKSQTQSNGNTQSKHFHSKNNYHVYNSNGGESKTLEDYFSKCEIRPSAMAIKPRGLFNNNHYSYINATLQSLLACPSFFNVMKYIPLTEDPSSHNVPCIKALHLFVNQFEKMDRSKSNPSNHKDIICGQPFHPTEVLQEIARLRQLSIEQIESKEDDAHQLLIQIFNELHDEICSINKSNSSNEQTSSQTNENLDEFDEDWLHVGKKHRTHIQPTNDSQQSLISEIFAGKFRISTNQKSFIFQTFFTLSLDIKDSKITTLDEALLRFADQTDNFDNKTRQTKSILIDHLPPILIIHLKSFLSDSNNENKKLPKSLNYTVNLSLPKNILSEQCRKTSIDRYKLFAVEYHTGDSSRTGHYFSDVFHPGLQGWIRYNDSNVQVVTSSQVINSSNEKYTPYLLFYRRGD